MKKINPRDLLNWAEISRYKAGNMSTIRKNRDCPTHKVFTDALVKAVKKVIDEDTTGATI
jgi:hypothetical protein